jgi:hypothetical protein
LIATICSSVSGRIATKGDSDKSSDQNVGLANAMPAGIARMTGIASVPRSSWRPLPASPRENHEKGATTATSTPPTSTGNARPEHRPSNQN